MIMLLLLSLNNFISFSNSLRMNRMDLDIMDYSNYIEIYSFKKIGFFSCLSTKPKVKNLDLDFIKSLLNLVYL